MGFILNYESIKWTNSSYQVHKVDGFHPQRVANDKSIKWTDSSYEVHKVDDFQVIKSIKWTVFILK